MSKDLVTVKEAAKMSDKSVNTIRYWLRQGYLTKHLKNSSKKNAPVHIDKTELMVYLAQEVQPNKPKEPTYQTKVSASFDMLRGEIAKLKEELSKTQNERDQALTNLDYKEELLKMSSQHLQDIKSIKEMLMSEKIQLKEKIARLEMKNEQLLIYFNTPWWKRIVNTVPLLEG